jgi:SAM-dependent methyltransferase
MQFFDFIRNALYEPMLANIDVDDPRMLDFHRHVLSRKRLLRSAFTSFYSDMARAADDSLNGQGLEIELGSGAGFFKDVRPSVITTDLREAPYIDRVIDAQAMDLSDASVRSIFAINVFHHLPDPDLFFSELARVLVSGGGCILVEPHIGFASRLLHTHLHKDEHYDPLVSSWKTSAIEGPMSGANQALSYVVFDRDRAEFDRRYGDKLEIVRQTYCLNSLRYFFSGGVNFKQLLPTFLGPTLRWIERLMAPFARYVTFHQLIVIRRR